MFPKLLVFLISVETLPQQLLVSVLFKTTAGFVLGQSVAAPGVCDNEYSCLNLSFVLGDNRNIKEDVFFCFHVSSSFCIYFLHFHYSPLSPFLLAASGCFSSKLEISLCIMSFESFVETTLHIFVIFAMKLFTLFPNCHVIASLHLWYFFVQ